MRSRPHKKNDQAYVEQKDCSLSVRHLVGYARLEGQVNLGCACRICMMLSDCTSTSFTSLPMKLVSKERTGAARIQENL